MSVFCYSQYLSLGQEASAKPPQPAHGKPNPEAASIEILLDSCICFSVHYVSPEQVLAKAVAPTVAAAPVEDHRPFGFLLVSHNVIPCGSWTSKACTSTAEVLCKLCFSKVNKLTLVYSHSNELMCKRLTY